MLEKPDLQDEKIIASLREEYGLLVTQVAFLPLGADQNAAVYRAVAQDETPYFVKVRRGDLDEISVALPKFLSDQGIRQIISPLATRAGRLWAGLDAYNLILYPFVEGHNAYKVELLDRHWSELGAALKRIHTTLLPPALASAISPESYSPQWREIVVAFVERVERDTYHDPVAVELAAFLRAKRDQTLDLVRRAERLAQALQARSPEFVLCHADIHAGNILLDAHQALYIVDWDSPVLAFKERDLMSIGAGLMGNWRTPQEEVTLFYRGYGPTPIDAAALAYYRYERIVQDIAVYCEKIFLSNEDGQDREQALRYLISNYLPNNTLELAYRSESNDSSAPAEFGNPAIES